MAKKNAMCLELIHSDAAADKAAKRAYNQQYYQAHKQYWKDYYKTGQGIGHTSKGAGLKKTEEMLSDAMAKRNELQRLYRDKYEMTGLTSEEKALKNKSLSSQAVLKRKIEDAEKEVERLKRMKKQIEPEDSKEYATMRVGGYKNSHGGGGGRW